LETQTETFEKAARIYIDLRRKGIMPRNSINVLIALTAVEYDLLLLHDDRDFDYMASAVKGLKVKYSSRKSVKSLSPGGAVLPDIRRILFSGRIPCIQR
jgi:hypothetical protein